MTDEGLMFVAGVVLISFDHFGAGITLVVLGLMVAMMETKK